MSKKIPTTQEIIDNSLSDLESNLDQTSPLNDKAFLRVLAGSLGLSMTGLYKYGVQRAAQNLAISATGEDLEKIGRNFGIIKKQATAAVIKILASGRTPGTVLPAGLAYIARANGIRYFSNVDITIPSVHKIVFNITAATPGSVGNITTLGSVFDLGQVIPGATETASWRELVAPGIEKEEEEDYRIRVLDEIRTVGGGSNSADYRRWSQEVPGVKRAFPFTGKPFTDVHPDVPGDRTVYIECVASVEPDGIAPATMLDAVRLSITTDPDTGEDRQCLGSTDSTLYINAITRKEFIFEIRGLHVDANLEAAAKTDLETELDNYVRSIRCYVDGLDSDVDKNNTLTSVGASRTINDVLRSYGGYADAVGFGVSPGSYLGSYTVNPGEAAKVGSVVYV